MRTYSRGITQTSPEVEGFPDQKTRLKISASKLIRWGGCSWWKQLLAHVGLMKLRVVTLVTPDKAIFVLFQESPTQNNAIVVWLALSLTFRSPTENEIQHEDKPPALQNGWPTEKRAMAVGRASYWFYKNPCCGYKVGWDNWVSVEGGGGETVSFVCTQENPQYVSMLSEKRVFFASHQVLQIIFVFIAGK